MWGKNRSVNLFTRVSLRARDIVFSDSGLRFEEPTDESGYGFNEYRVVGSTASRASSTRAADALVDRHPRPGDSFELQLHPPSSARRGRLRLSPRYSITGRYSFEHNELFDEKFTDEEKPLIDRLFPQVRLSKFSGSLLRDSRTDLADADGGSLLVATTDLAARAFGSEVGFVKTYLQAFSYRRLPSARRIVLALGARVGAAHGFVRAVPRVGDDGNPCAGPTANRSSTSSRTCRRANGSSPAATRRCAAFRSIGSARRKRSRHRVSPPAATA